VGVDEVAVQVDGLLVVLGGFGEFLEDEVELRAMIVNVGIVLVLGDCQVKVVLRCFSVACYELAKQRISLG
jgi:hypothetical protein